MNHDELIQGLGHYPVTISLDKCNGSCNIILDPSWRIYVPKKTEDISLNVFNMIKEKN